MLSGAYALAVTTFDPALRSTPTIAAEYPGPSAHPTTTQLTTIVGPRANLLGVVLVTACFRANVREHIAT